MTLVPPVDPSGRTPGGHGLLEATPRIYQVTPDIPDRRRATKQKESQALAGRQPQRESARRRSGPSPAHRTSPTARNHNSKPLSDTVLRGRVLPRAAADRL